jgi:lysophospholipase L1-like esterase
MAWLGTSHAEATSGKRLWRALAGALAVFALHGSLAACESEDTPATADGTDPGASVDAGALGPTTTSSPDAGIASTPVIPSLPTATTTSADAGVVSTDGGMSSAVSAGRKPKCMAKDSQLVVVGDSYINWISHTFPEDIKKESGQTWRMEAVGGYSMGSGGIGSIPQEFYDSIAKDPDAHTVLMDGGGNDVLVPDFSNAFFYECTNKGAAALPQCQKIVTKAIEVAGELRDKAAAAGIRNVVYFFYPHVPANTVLSGDGPAEILDYALPKVRAFCENMERDTGGKTQCTFIDMIPVFKGHDDWFNEDIHPNAKGSAAMAKEIWRVMSEKCIGQKGPKDCCES